MIPPKLNVVTLGVRDLSRMRDFYSALGWPLAVEADDFALFGMRGALLGLFPRDKLAADGGAEASAPQSGMRGFSLGINVDRPEQVDEAIESARGAGARITKEPADPREFGGRHAYFADPEDNFWEVVYFAGSGPAREALRRATG